MEHLPLPEGAEHFIQVPYYAPDAKRDWYDCEGHQEYPQRMGWREEDLLGNVPEDEEGPPFGSDKEGNPRKPLDIERFFQTWLFFGTAIEVLKAGGIHATTEDFLQPKGITKARIVTTSKLPSLLLEWNKSGKDKESLWSKTKLILERTLFYLNLFCHAPKDKHPSDRRKSVTWPVRDEISTSMIALVFSLREAAKHKCDEGGLTEIHACSKTLYRRLERKWCLSDAARVEDELDIDGHYFLSMSPGLTEDDLDNHIRCTRDRCNFIMDENLYVAKHAPSPWHQANCKPASWGGPFGGMKRGAKDWVDSVCKIIQAGAIPIVLWSVKTRQYYTVEFHKDGMLKPPYIAISHVWADCKGNPDENSLPVCQIEYIQNMVEKVPYEGRGPPPIGTNSDGVGFWMDTMCVPLHSPLRKRAIAGMRDVYENAKCVLILDEWLQQIPSTAAIPVVLTRLYQSSWIKRLWTHQEGFFPKELFVQFSDKAVKLETITDRRVAYEKDMATKGIYLQFPNLTSLRLSDQYGFIKRAYGDLVQGGNAWMLYPPLAHIMRVRQTSRQADETVCLATILHLDPYPLLDIPDKPDAEAARQRMAIFLKMVGKFHMGLIFNNWDRLQSAGFTWAPKSLLGHRGGLDDSNTGVWDQRSSEIQWHGDLPGLPVEYPGFSTFDFSQVTRQSISCADQAFAIQSDQGDSLIYMVEVYTSTSNEIAWNSWGQYTIILSKIPDKDDEGVLAIMGEGATGYSEVTEFLHFCLVRVRILKGERPDWIDVVNADILPAETKWLVR